VLDGLQDGDQAAAIRREASKDAAQLIAKAARADARLVVDC
jgi:hypothetical protein